MAGKQFLKKHENCILSLAMALILAGILYHAAGVSAGSIACAVVPGAFDPGIRRVFAFLPVWEYLGGRIQEHRTGGRGAGST